MRKLTLSVAITVLVTSMCACSLHPTRSVPHLGLEAKTAYFETLDEMEEFSDVIIVGTRLDEEVPVINTSDGHLLSCYTFSKFCISKIHKDNTSTLKEKDIITILENEVYDEEQDIVYHVAGYNMMENGKDYLLFLQRDTYNSVEYYVSAGVNFGTVSLQDDNRKIDRYDDMGNEVVDYSRFENIWNEAINKYVNEGSAQLTTP